MIPCETHDCRTRSRSHHPVDRPAIVTRAGKPLLHGCHRRAARQCIGINPWSSVVARPPSVIVVVIGEIDRPVTPTPILAPLPPRVPPFLLTVSPFFPQFLVAFAPSLLLTRPDLPSDRASVSDCPPVRERTPVGAWTIDSDPSVSVRAINECAPVGTRPVSYRAPVSVWPVGEPTPERPWSVRSHAPEGIRTSKSAPECPWPVSNGPRKSEAACTSKTPVMETRCPESLSTSVKTAVASSSSLRIGDDHRT